MSQSNPSFLSSLANFFRSLFGSPPPPPPSSQPPVEPTKPDFTPEPLVPLAPRILVLVYDPIVDPMKNLTLVEWGRNNRGWSRVDDLITGYIADVDECSGGLVKYNVVERINIPEFPVKADGFRYNAIEFLDMYTNHMDRYHQPDRVDYYKIIADHRLQERVDKEEIDEVWLFAPPFAGLYESIMCGTAAFWCNAAPLENTRGRRYVIMGFSYERGVGEMEEDLGHRMESLMARIYNAQDFLGWTYGFRSNPTQFDALKYAERSLFGKFLLHDKIAPGNAECGNVHYAPNSDRDYDWGNQRPVVTFADDWLSFPDFPRVAKMQNATSWGNGDIRGHHRWWFNRFPKIAGRMNGVRMNWWSYICDVTNPEFDKAVSGEGIHLG